MFRRLEVYKNTDGELESHVRIVPYPNQTESITLAVFDKTEEGTLALSQMLTKEQAAKIGEYLVKWAGMPHDTPKPTENEIIKTT